MPRRSRPTTHRERPGSTPPRLVAALGTWAGLLVAAGALALELAGAPAGAGAERDAVAATAAAAPVTILLASDPTTTVPAPTTIAAPTTTSPPPVVEAPPSTEPPAEPAPRSAPTVEATPPPVVEAPPATDPPPPPVPAPAAAADVDTAAEAMLLDDHNRRRAESGLPPLVRNACLDQVARDWARQMASSGTMRHNPDLGAAIDRCIAYTAAGENVGYGPDVAVLAARFWESPAHRANIVGSYQHVGIGIVVGADGTRWAAVEFAAG